MKRSIVALLIVVATVLAIRVIAARKNEELAGPATYRLDGGPERQAFDALLDELGRLEQVELATRLRALDAEGLLWVAPFLPGERQAVYVSSLGLIERIYLDREALLLEELPFQDSEVPEDWRRLYAVIRLGGTLYHEIQHLDGVLDEAVAYRREAAWYSAIAKTGYVGRLEGEAERRYDWALESAILSVGKAAERAGT